MRRRRRSTLVLLDQTSLEALRALQRLYVSGGGSSVTASGEDESSIPATSSGVVIRIQPGGWYMHRDSTQGIEVRR